MTSNTLYNVFSAVTIFYLCFIASASPQSKSNGQHRDVTTVVASKQQKSQASGTSCAIKPKKTITSTITIGSVRETFFTRMNEHNTEAFNLLNQLWHSKAGWTHVNTKDGRMIISLHMNNSLSVYMELVLPG